MANVATDTGHGATLTFGTDTYAWSWTKLDLGTVAKPAVDTSHLGSSKRTFMAGDLVDHGEFTVEYLFDCGDDAPQPGASQTCTITFPTPTGLTTPATYAGTAIVTACKLPELVSEQLQMGTLTCRWTGATGPTFTKAA